LLENDSVTRLAIEETGDTRYTESAVDFLDSQGVVGVNPDSGRIHLLDKGKSLRRDYAALLNSVYSYKGIQEVLKGSLDLDHDPSRISPALKNVLNNIDQVPVQYVEALLPPAITFFHEKGGDSLVSMDRSGEELLYIKVLIRKGILKGSIDKVVITEKGKKLFKLGGYAELTTSYYEMAQEMTPLAEGEKFYGLGKDVNRDPVLNARASNGILNLRVAPYITSVLTDEDVFIDYGSGGGKMVCKVMKDGPQGIKGVGIDVNEKANAEASKFLDESGVGNRVELVTGSITDPAVLKSVENKITNGTHPRVAASINFILHDIGPKLAKDFLRNHAAVFKDAPLIITETFLMSPEVIRAHPNYQAASFQFMHKASGQHLYTEEELRALLAECGYEILHEKTHSSMPGVEPGERHTTIATWKTRFKG